MTHRSRLAGMIIDCQAEDPGAGAAFWSAALGAAATPTEAGYVTLADQGGLHLEVQAVNHPSRVHLDIEADDIEAEVARLKTLGATEVVRLHTWVVMEAPTGHRFCVIRAQTADFDEKANHWD